MFVPILENVLLIVFHNPEKKLPQLENTFFTAFHAALKAVLKKLPTPLKIFFTLFHAVWKKLANPDQMLLIPSHAPLKFPLSTSFTTEKIVLIAFHTAEKYDATTSHTDFIVFHAIEKKAPLSLIHILQYHVPARISRDRRCYVLYGLLNLRFDLLRPRLISYYKLLYLLLCGCHTLC